MARTVEHRSLANATLYQLSYDPTRYGKAKTHAVKGGHDAVPPPNRKPWLAFLMSFVLPGAGQLYTGHATRGLIWYLAITTYGFGFMHWHTPWINFGVKGFVFAWSLVLLGHFLAGAEAAVSARRSARRRPYQKWPNYRISSMLRKFMVAV